MAQPAGFKAPIKTTTTGNSGYKYKGYNMSDMYEPPPIKKITTTSGGTPPPTGKTAADLAAEALAAYLASLQKTQRSSGGSNISYQAASIPEYNPQPYQVSLPSIDWSFNPTEAQRGGWQTQATATAAQEIDPQLQAIQAALQNYKTQGQNQRNELNPRYTNQSLAIANIIKNSVKQEAIDNAIRRGAETSGWLPSALMEAGNLETEQRGGIEAQRNQDLAALAALESQQTQAAGEQGTMLEGLRGKRITTALAELENKEWERDLQQKMNQWSSALGGEQLRAGAYGDNAANQLAGYQTQASVGMSNADRALQAAIASANQGNVEYQNQYTAAQDAYQAKLQAAQMAQRNASSSSNQGAMVNTPYGMLPLQVADALGYVEHGKYSTNSNEPTEFEQWLMSK